MNGQIPTLTIVLPAYNEEDAIGETIARCLGSRDLLRDECGLGMIEVIVVSDGSTDRTAEIAGGYTEASLVILERNRGYGAAIKEGFRRGTGSIVGFMDADGTCDPRDFVGLCRSILQEDTDLALGSRLGPGSRMPALRKWGNRAFALLLGTLCSRNVTDTASGIRVIRRDALRRLGPLPDGMHFTPAMSARALLSGLRVVEIPIRYRERVGSSKLSALTDGARFVGAILEGVLCYRPERLFIMGFSSCSLLLSLLALYPVEFYWRHRFLENWMIYRFVACSLLGAAGALLLCAAALCHRMDALGPRHRDGDTFLAPLAAKLFEGRGLALLLGVTLSTSLAVLWPGVVEYVWTHHTSLHWSRLLAGGFGLLLSFQACVTAVLLKVVAIWRAQLVSDDWASDEVANPEGRRDRGSVLVEDAGVSSLRHSYWPRGSP